MNKILIVIAFLSITLISAQETKKNLITKRVNTPPKIDGILNDKAWLNTNIAKDFVMFRPTSGSPENKNNRTEVRVVYDDEAIYFAAYLYDENPNEIPKEYANRDSFGSADWFAIIINPNNDFQNDTEFFIQATGNQADAKSTPNDEDFSWSAVWDSEVKIVKDGWIIEVKIPYAALRFSNSEIQTWGLNFHRHFRSNRHQYSWNFIDRTKGVIQQYSGTLSGIKNIKPSTRLNFSPYASTAYNSYDGEDNFESNIGLDLKYGINESFTLDATLIPDFGQTAFDDLVLNLGPFEEQYQEQRPFFTEGTELFSKGDLFYSRRIGNTPVDYFTDKNLSENETIIYNPDKVNMLNAIKVSGRTKGGLGIGVFNAVTEKTEAKIKNLTTDEIRKVVTEPLANYNVLILDQQFNKNSSVSLINTNVLRNGSARDANATGLLYTLVNKKNTHFIDGSFKTSNIKENGNTTNGYYFDTSVGKFAGKIQYELGYRIVDENFNINDLGFQNTNNYQKIYSSISYRIFEPTKFFTDYSLSSWANLNYRKTHGDYMDNEVGISFSATTLKQLSFGANINSVIGANYNYYEPRVEGRFYKDDPEINYNGWISSDFSKKFAIESSLFYSTRIGESRDYIEFELEPRYRFSDKFNVIYGFNIGFGNNSKGWVNKLEDGTIIFGNRDSKNITNSISGRYNFDIKSGLSLTFRHYWSPIEYDSQYFSLNENGTLSPNSYSKNHNINFNTWNLDLSYSWQFAPGSQLVALYRNAIFNEDDNSNLNFNKNLTNLFNQPKQHNLSLKLIYYLDYNNVKTWL
ncbi:carbohydrate binding family 9 domain-containing protein [Lutibacter sp. A80]|uniref:DUF5916 domain-containing protein n=1 Tax=Lutibacter sp. A80 TaxID=2918453 RepID=UPI001F070C4D|nr:DUF5916 domain-containing protein [Lutibacter sp. A80]UMB61565.1 carbohydrate binding family 9 domain-containing protein [Lutibacter sp. A80]